MFNTFVSCISGRGCYETWKLAYVKLLSSDGVLKKTRELQREVGLAKLRYTEHRLFKEI